MRRYFLLSAILLAVACSNSTGPGHDPVLLIRNQDPGQSITFTWQDGQGTVGAPVIINTVGDFCERFTAQPDSAFYEFVRADSTNGWHTYQSNWFDPTARPTWTVDIVLNGAHNIIVKDTTAVPC